jgi:hypothetical protein
MLKGTENEVLGGKWLWKKNRKRLESFNGNNLKRIFCCVVLRSLELEACRRLRDRKLEEVKLLCFYDFLIGRSLRSLKRSFNGILWIPVDCWKLNKIQKALIQLSRNFEELWNLLKDHNCRQNRTESKKTHFRASFQLKISSPLLMLQVTSQLSSRFLS